MDQFDSPVEQALIKIGQRVRELRKTKYPNYEDFAKIKNLNKVTVNRCERGLNTKTSRLIEIIQALDVSLEEFFKEL